jgi:hypothetical protein
MGLGLGLDPIMGLVSSSVGTKSFLFHAQEKAKMEIIQDKQNTLNGVHRVGISLKSVL